MEKEILYRFIEGTSSSDEEQQVRQWLEASEANRKTLLDEYRFFDMTTLHTAPKQENLPSKGTVTGNKDTNAGIDAISYPQPRSFTIGAKLAF